SPAGTRRQMMHIHVGFEMIYDSPQPTPIIFNLNVHFTRVSDLLGRDALVVDPPVPVAAYRDGFGNGPVTRGGRTGKGNPYLKGVLGDAAAAAAKTSTFLGQRYRRIVKRRGKLKALVAVARSIL